MHRTPSALIVRVLACLFVVGVAGCQSVSRPASSATPRAVSDPDRWRLVWHDEFDGEAVDERNWGYDTGFIRNEELQYYTDGTRNAWIDDGKLVIEARRERITNERHDPTSEDWRRARAEGEYTSAALTTSWRREWTHGRVEVRAKLPTGRGVWPAIWLLGRPDPPMPWPRRGEIDIMEHVGHQPGVIHATIHTETFSRGKHISRKRELPDLGRAYHVHWVEWDDARLTIGVDDDAMLTVDNDGGGVARWPFDHPYFLILNIAVGGWWGGAEGVDASVFPVRMHIDWVRVYERVPAARE